MTDLLAAAISAQSHLGLPHRPPFVFVRKIISCEPGLHAEGETSFGADMPMFSGHFPGNPLVPGVILTEALAQLAGITAASGFTADPPLFLLSAIRGMKFLGAVRPDEIVRLHAKKMGEVNGLLQFQVEAFTADRLVAEGQLVLSISGPSKTVDVSKAGKP